MVVLKHIDMYIQNILITKENRFLKIYFFYIINMIYLNRYGVINKWDFLVYLEKKIKIIVKNIN